MLTYFYHCKIVSFFIIAFFFSSTRNKVIIIIILIIIIIIIIMLIILIIIIIIKCKILAVLKSKLNGGNAINAINIWAVAMVRYGAG